MVEGLVCPAVTELICEALRSSGRFPGACRPVGPCRGAAHQRVCAAHGAAGQEPRPVSLELGPQRTSTLQLLDMHLMTKQQGR